MDISPLIIGVDGVKADAALMSRLKRVNPAGILLLSRNIESARQVLSLTKGIVQGLGRPIIFAIDHEGGNVVRFSRDVTAFPSPAALGRLHSPKIAYAVGREMALELSALGINFNLAPVLDVAGVSYNPGIGIRSFGRDPVLVSKMGRSFIRGLQDHGVWACAKHFPGMGDAVLDPHIVIPEINASLKNLKRRHWPPFVKAIESDVAAIMTSHVRYPQLDSLLATFSPVIVNGFLRKELGFKGLVISDDLSMGAVASGRDSVSDAAVRSFCAGHDLLIIADRHERVWIRAADAIFEASRSESVLASNLDLSRKKVVAILNRKKLNGDFRESSPSSELAARIGREALRVLNIGNSFPLRPASSPALVIFPKLSEIKTRFAFEGGPQGPAAFVKSILKNWGSFRFMEAPVASCELKNLELEIRKANKILFFCFEARRFPGQKAVLDLINRLGARKTVTVLMRGSSDEPLIAHGAAVIDPAGDRLCQIHAALKEILQ